MKKWEKEIGIILLELWCSMASIILLSLHKKNIFSFQVKLISFEFWKI